MKDLEAKVKKGLDKAKEGIENLIPAVEELDRQGELSDDLRDQAIEAIEQAENLGIKTTIPEWYTKKTKDKKDIKSIPTIMNNQFLSPA